MLLHKFFSWTLNRLLCLRMSYFKWMHISKTWFSRFFLCLGMKLEFLLLTGIKKQSSVLFLDRNNRSFAGLCGFKMRANKKFFLLRLPNCFSMCLDSDKNLSRISCDSRKINCPTGEFRYHTHPFVILRFFR